ncbi:MAG: hypothetical protein ACRDT2_19880, partial [Natronosporangium sp.]
EQTKRQDEEPGGLTKRRRIRVSADLPPDRYDALHRAAIEYRTSKIGLINALVDVLDEPGVEEALERRLGARQR